MKNCVSKLLKDHNVNANFSKRALTVALGIYRDYLNATKIGEKGMVPVPKI
jgi:hypothetical protein